MGIALTIIFVSAILVLLSLVIYYSRGASAHVFIPQFILGGFSLITALLFTGSDSIGGTIIIIVIGVFLAAPTIISAIITIGVIMFGPEYKQK